MANGDIAAAAGIPKVDSTDDRRMGYDEINRALDQIVIRTRPKAVFKVSRGATQIVPAADTVLAALWGVPERTDDATFAWNAAAGALTVKIAGYYEIDAAVQIGLVAANVTVTLSRNGTSAVEAAKALDSESRTATTQTRTFAKLRSPSVYLAAGDVIRVLAWPGAQVPVGDFTGPAAAGLTVRAS